MISIIGAGPSGCYTAYLLAKAGKEVQIFEEHKKIGEPVQCTGLITSSINDILKLKKDTIINEIDKVKIFSKNNSLELKLKNKNLILDRKKFDNNLADMAIEQGTKIFLNYKFIDFQNSKNSEGLGMSGKQSFPEHTPKSSILDDSKNFQSNKNNLIKLKFNNQKETTLKTDYLIGADGPLSQVAKSNNIFKKRKFMTGIQAVVKLENENYIEFYPSIGEFAWVVPENKEICRIGVASYNNPKEDFNKFLKSKNITNKDIIEKQGGLIPLYNPKQKTKKDNVYLIGDAAAQVKATTGGGIIQGLKAAEALADSIINKGDYERQWKKEIGKDLSLHLKMRNIMDKFKDKDWDLLIRLFKKNSTKSIIESFDRDYPTKFMLRLILNEPRLLYFSKFLF